jgi:hypothetical protein
LLPEAVTTPLSELADKQQVAPVGLFDRRWITLTFGF